MERARLGEAEAESDLGDAEAVVEILLRELLPDRLAELLKRRSFVLEAALEAPPREAEPPRDVVDGGLVFTPAGATRSGAW